MKKLIVFIFIIALIATGYSFSQEDEEVFDLNTLVDYQKKYLGEEIDVCSNSSVKSYMDYKAVTDSSSYQYHFIRNNMTVDKQTGLLFDEEQFIGVAMGSYFGKVGDRFYITLDTGVILPVVMIDSKDDRHTRNGCEHISDSSVIEFVIDSGIAAEYFGRYSNGYILQGNFNNYKLFSGCISKVEKVSDTLNEDYVTYYKSSIEEISDDIFQYASGY